jgi:hypothetical protein
MEQYISQCKLLGPSFCQQHLPVHAAGFFSPIAAVCQTKQPFFCYSALDLDCLFFYLTRLLVCGLSSLNGKLLKIVIFFICQIFYQIVKT